MGNNSKRLLIGEYDALINTYWFCADPLLMIRNSEEGVNWLINNFIEITYSSDCMPYSIYFFNDRCRNKTVEFYNCPLWHMQKIDFNEDKKIFNMNIVEFVQKCLNEDKYVLFMVNRKYIKHYGIDTDNLHQILIHGYDNNMLEFYYADSVNNGKFMSQLKCSYQELEEAFKKSYFYSLEPDFGTSVFVFKIENSKPYPINIIRIKRMIYAYKESSSETDNGKPSGISVYKALIEYYENSLKNGEKIDTDIRGLHTLYDHKKAMIFRLMTIKDMYDIDIEWISEYKIIEDISKSIIHMMLKYIMVGDVNLIKRIIDKLNEVYLRELVVLEKIVRKFDELS